MTETTTEHSAAAALKIIAAAEALALQRIEAARAISSSNVSNDHDELMKLIQSVEDFHEEMRRTLESLRSDYHGKMSDHEARLNVLESANTRQNVMLSIAIVVGGFLAALLIYHVSGIKL